ncbi:MAG: T9SS type A sorting domain-containing protein [Bacteroidales bacterium]|nr:T9SS type A sorting domain-containing protein [Bacteroidales bacterium]
MRRLLLLSLVLASFMAGLTQQRVTIPEDLRNFAEKKVPPVLETMNFSHEVLPSSTQDFVSVEEDIIGSTYFDLQSNASMQNRIFVYDDGTIGGVWTLGFDFPNFDDRGTGYNYYDGSAWGSNPTGQLEDDRTGWPAYAAWGENGEINVAHYSGAAYDGLVYARRTEKGTGDWTLIDYLTPVGNEMVWPRMTTGGVNHSIVHQIALTRPIANGGSLCQGIDGALLYSRSPDGGDTWDMQDVLFDELNSTNYLAFYGDTYEVQADGDNVAILYGDSWTDLGLLKSTDGGDTWTQTIIWEHPYPMWDPNAMYPTDTFYCADGAHGLAFDQDGMVHIVFGINRAHSDGEGTFWFHGVGGIGYWNETRPTFSNDLNALCPFADCIYSELVEDYSLIGWTQDINNNGTIDILWDDIAKYYLGLSSMPQIIIDDLNNIYVVYSSVTETYENGTQSYRHLWARWSYNGDFWGSFFDLTSDLIHIFDECVFPSVASFSDDWFYLVYQVDTEPGMAVKGDEDPYGENFIRFMKVYKGVGIFENKSPDESLKVSQNIPNPFSKETMVQIELFDACNVSLEVTNLTGQKVLEINKGHLPVGIHNITLKADGLSLGLYFYTVNAGDAAVTKKMILE